MSSDFVADPARRGRRTRLRLLLGTALLAVPATLFMRSFYVVQPTELAGVRRFGTVVVAAPVGPGLHLRTPFDTVDRLQVSLSSFAVDDLTVYTVDNQPVRIGIGLTYRVPPAAVFKLLYDVGRSGNVDIDATLRPIVADRALRVFARHNTVAISSEREQIADQIRAEVIAGVTASFGLDILDLQLSRIEYSDSFLQSVEAAVKAKNEALQAENTVARIRYEGEQAKVQAEAEAVATLSRARAAKDAAVMKAQAEAQSIELTGAAQAHALQMTGAALAASPRIVEYETARRWSGQLPATMLAGGAVPFLSLSK